MGFAWKCLEKGMKSRSGDVTWKKGKWREHEGDIKLCSSGFHASKRLIDAMHYVSSAVVALVEYDDVVEEQDDKFVCRKMRVVKTYPFTKRMSVQLAVYSARLCLKNFEDLYPDDSRPRDAIIAAERWLVNPSKKNESAAWSAWSAARSAARSAGSAWSAVEAAAGSAWSAVEAAAEAAWSAAGSAAWSARSAARSAGSAAGSAARSAGSAARSAGSAARSAARSAGSAARSAARNEAFDNIEKELMKIIGFKKSDKRVK